MMTGVITALCCVAVISACGASFSRRSEGARTAWAGIAAMAYLALAVAYAIMSEWPLAGLETAFAAYWAWMWWRNRRKRKRPLRALGNKARARLAEMIANMPGPGPVLRPVPA